MKIWKFLAVATLACAPTITWALDVEFINRSAWEIHEVYFSPASQSNWGEDYLGNDVLEKGDSLTLSDVEAGTWDVMIIDEDGDKCVIEDVRLTSSDRWVITDDDLLGCQAGS